MQFYPGRHQQPASWKSSRCPSLPPRCAELAGRLQQTLFPELHGFILAHGKCTFYGCVLDSWGLHVDGDAKSDLHMDPELRIFTTTPHIYMSGRSAGSQEAISCRQA